LTLTNAASPPGSVLIGTNALDRNVSGNRISIEIPCTLRALRAIVPVKVKIQAIAHPVKIASRIAPSTPSTPPPGRYPMINPVTKVSPAAMR
jgi:hypothetical protein